VLSALKAEGLAVQEYGSWRTNNRNSKGPWGPVYGVVIHHTVTSADDSSVALCYNGHSTLPGPLCHAVGRNDGKIATVGHGRANHAGLGDDDVLAAVKNETPLPVDNEAVIDGNRYFYGLEIVNLGNGTDTYPWVQYVSAVKWATAYCRAHKWTEKSVIGHKEWQPGKIDPKGPVVGPDGVFEFTMNRFRADVRAALALPAGVWPKQAQEEEDVALTDDDVKRIAHAVWRFANLDIDPRDMRQITADAASGAKTAATVAQEVENKVDNLTVGGGVDLDVLAAKVADVLAARLSG
jgi:hypothetical protein